MAPTDTIQLKLHVESPPEEVESEPIRGAATLAESLTQATGWRFAFRRSPPNDEEQLDGWAPRPAGRFVIDSPVSDEKRSIRDADQLLNSVNSLLVQLNETQHALWQREAELAVCGPIKSRTEDATHLAARLEAALKGGAEAIGCDAAAAYILNEETTHLKLRCSWGLPTERMLQPPRELRGAIADLEALMGHAVALEDTSDGLPWEPPEPEYGAALCVPISTPSTPLGSLWMYARDPRPFTSEESNIVELVAGRIAAELEREMMVAQDTAASHIQRQLEAAGEWFTRRLPQITPLTSQWQFAGSRLDETPGGDFYDWSVQPDGRLACAVGDCPGYNIETLLQSAAFKATYQSLLQVNSSPAPLLQMINDSLWSGSPGDVAASMFYTAIDEDTGVMEYASAGEPLAIAIRDTRFRSLIESSPPLGVDPDQVLRGRRRRVAPDETLIVMTESVRHLLLRNGKPLTEAMVARAARPLMQLDAQSLQAALADWLLNQCEGPAAKTSLLVVRRRPPRD